MKKPSLVAQPKTSRRAAKVIQKVPVPLQAGFIRALETHTSVLSLPEPYKSWMINGYSE